MNEVSQLMFSCGLSRKGLAALINKSPASVVSYCLGRRKISEDDLIKLRAYKKARDRIFS